MEHSNQLILIFMSLLIVGSCSRVTQNIIRKVAQTGSHKSVTILDLLPTYNFHQRFYLLQKNLSSLPKKPTVTINKLVLPQDLARGIQQHDDLVCVTHDYFQSVTSKTKIMELTAELSKNKNPVFAAPLEYDHFGVADPEAQFTQAQERVLKKNPNASFVRSDIQDSTEFLALLHHPKNLLEERSFNIVESSQFTETVLENLRGGQRGQTTVLTGQAQDALTAPYNRQVELHETKHHLGNVVHLIQKYRSLISKVEKSA